MIGKVGSLLGDHAINIGTMQVGRADIGGEAMMVLTLDKKTPKLVINQLSSIKGLNTAQLLELNTMNGRE